VDVSWAVAIFAVFLFLTYYLQQVLGFSPIVTGLAFLPLTAGIVTASTSANILLLPRTGPRPLLPVGMALGATGMFLLTRLTPTSSYAGGVLPSLVILGLGFGLIFAPSFTGGTFGVARQETGVASATLNTMQQVGGSIGTALLSTLAASATASYARVHTGPDAQVLAAVHGYTTAFTVSGAIFVFGAVLTAVLLPSGPLVASHPAPSPFPSPRSTTTGTRTVTGPTMSRRSPDATSGATRRPPLPDGCTGSTVFWGLARSAQLRSVAGPGARNPVRALVELGGNGNRRDADKPEPAGDQA